jgi:hypothetical protein
MKQLIGLGLNYCLKIPILNSLRNLDLDRFQRDFLLKIYFAGLKHDTDEFCPNPYIWPDWSPPLDEIPRKCKKRIDTTISYLCNQIPDYNMHSELNMSIIQRKLIL